MSDDEHDLAARREALKSARFSHLVGLKLEEARPGYAKMSLAAREEVKQTNGVIHGGALATLADTAVAFALSTLLPKDQKMTTIELKINYLEPIRDGKVIAEARILRKGKRIVVGEVDIFDENAQLAAKGLITYMILSD